MRDIWFEGVPRNLSSECDQPVTKEVKDRMWGPCCTRLLLCEMDCLPFDMHLVRCWVSRSLFGGSRDLLPNCAPTLHIPTVAPLYLSLISANYSALAVVVIIVKRGLAETNMVDEEMQCVFQLFQWPPIPHLVLENSKTLVEEDGN